MGLGDRISRLERLQPPTHPYETPPIMTLLIKEMNAERLELDGRPPDPASEPTLEELEAGLEGAIWFVETGAELLRASSSANPATLENIAQMEVQARQEIEGHDNQPTERSQHA